MSDQLFADLIEVANRYGESEYSRAGGGNASVKVDGVLHIKPSGVPLLTLTKADLDGLNGALGRAAARDPHSDGIVVVGLGTPWMPSLWRRHLRVAAQIGAGSAIRLRYFSPDDRVEMVRTWFSRDAIGMGEVYLVRGHDEVVSFWAFRPW